MDKKIGCIILLSGPSGAGKSSILTPILSKNENLQFSVSCTTRLPRAGEINGVHYHFLTVMDFQKKISDNQFLEYARVHGNFYGTLKSAVLETVLSGKDVILDIDVQGAMQIKKMLESEKSKAGDILLRDLISFIFIAPPSFAELESRLRTRATETEDAILKRLANSKGELAAYEEYEFLVINNNLEDAIKDLESIISATKNRCSLHKYFTKF